MSAPEFAIVASPERVTPDATFELLPTNKFPLVKVDGAFPARSLTRFVILFCERVLAICESVITAAFIVGFGYVPANSPPADPDGVAVVDGVDQDKTPLASVVRTWFALPKPVGKVKT